ncbi:MAG: hypothetical protein KIC89_21700 [Acetobacteraceae bacterium]|nr:hypothetical protein [Acetobacteraceae bacterium]
MTTYSTPTHLARIRDILCSYFRLPFSGDRIPGDVMEGTLAQVRDATRLGRYDFIDVVKEAERVGWQVKSTAEGTPVTWKRAKIEGRTDLIAASETGAEGRRALGKAIIDFCNAAVARDFERYAIDQILYARLIVHPDATATYFERELATRREPRIFDPSDFEWHWTTQRTGLKKEQLSAFHGIQKASGKKWWAWHGRGENQLHFSGESEWWPSPVDPHSIRFDLPTERFSLDELLELLDPKAGKPDPQG